MPPKISIIVPVYNVEKYLEQCLNSIIAQSLSDIQIICINDGSTDCSKSILRQFSQKDSRILLLEQSNSGYGASVNKGLSASRADYIGIVEPDDFIDPLTFESLYNTVVKCQNPDIVKFAYYEYFDQPDGTHLIKSSQSSHIETHLYPFKIERYPELLHYHPSIWSGIYRREFLIKNDIKFVEAPGAGWTDNPFFVSVMCHAETIVWSNECHYYYRKTNPNASSNLKDCNIPILRALDIIDLIEKIPITEPIVRRFLFKRCLIYIQTVTESQYYNAKETDILIRQMVSRIPCQEIIDDFFTPQEQAIYRIFNKKSQNGE